MHEPGLARAEGTIFVHRPANFTHFRYDPPHTMESFFRLARKELYSETEGRLKLRISPSNAFRQSGKLLLPITEHKTSYINPGEDGETREDVWRESIVETWLTPQEDVWAIKVFVGVHQPDSPAVPADTLTQGLHSSIPWPARRRYGAQVRAVGRLRTWES